MRENNQFGQNSDSIKKFPEQTKIYKTRKID